VRAEMGLAKASVEVGREGVNAVVKLFTYAAEKEVEKEAEKEAEKETQKETQKEAEKTQ